MKIHFPLFVPALLIFLVAHNSLGAQQVTFKREGSYFGMVNGISQDPQGYMWFSSYNLGLYRYDGYRITEFKNDPSDPRSLASNQVACVLADKKGFIWVGTTNAGLDRFDPRTGIFTHFRHKKLDPTSLSDESVITILEDQKGIIWVGTQNGLNWLDQRSGTFTQYQQKPGDATSLSCNRVQVLYEDHQGTLWVGTANDQRFYTSNEQGGLNRMDRKTGRFTRFLHDPKNSHSLISNRIGAIFEDSRGVFWVSTAEDGLHTMDKYKGTFERHLYSPAHPENLSGPPPEKEVGLDMNNFFVTEDSSGAIWIASSKRWITRYDPKTKKVTHFDSFNGDAQAVHSVTKAFCSRDGMLWITSWAGSVYRVDPFEINIPHVFTGYIVQNVHEDASGVLWLGTFGEGLFQIDRRKGVPKRILTGSLRHGLSDSWVPAIYETGDTLWIGSGSGLSQYNKKTKTFTRFVNDPRDSTSVTKGFVDAIIEDKPGSLWIGTQGGLDYLDVKSNRFTHYRHDPNDPSSLSDNTVRALLKDHSGGLWVCTDGGIINLFDLQTKKFKHFHCGRAMGTIMEDSENIIWVGTSNGLYRSNHSIDTFLNFSRAEIGLTSTTIVTGILEDDQRNIWVASSAGILRLGPDRNQISVYNKNQNVDASALTSPRMHGAKGKSGEFFFGDRTGYYHFFPGQIKKNTVPPQIVVSAFRLADQIVKPSKGGPLNGPLNQAKEIRLKHNQNVFSFDFAGIHFRSPDDNQHFYMLENLDNAWRKTGPEKRAYYYNVPPGRYIFRVKVSNGDGIWAEKAITLVISPPWWRTWWAYLLYVVSSVIIAWLFTWYRSRKLKEENLLLEEKVIKRTKELEQSLEERYELTRKVESQQALLNERLRISRELHDDIGSTLGSISIYSEVAKNRTEKNENTNEVLTKIGLASRELIDKMSDIVWSLNPNNEGFEHLESRMMAFAAMILTPRNIRFNFIADKELKERESSAEQRKNIFLIFKEALYNVVKYADCKNVSITLSLRNNQLMMIIQDDGKGFDVAQMLTNGIIPSGDYLGGNGIKNMQARAEDMNARLCINSKADEGTTVQLTFA